MTPARVAVAVVHHGDAAPCRACLESLRASEGTALKVCVIDHNAEPSADLGHLAGTLGGTYLHDSRNPGFAAGVNRGWEALRSDRPWELYAALNSDVRLAPDCLEKLARAAAADPGLGVVGPGLLAEGDVPRWWSLGGRIEWPSGRPRSLHHGEPASPSGEAPRDVDFVAGAVLAVPARAHDALGRLDESCFLYFEDAEYSFRARAAGFRVQVCPEALAWHVGGAATAGLGARAAYFQARNRLRFSRRWNPRRRAGALHRMAFAARCMGRGLLAACAGRRTRSYWAARGAWSYLAGTRRSGW